MSDPRESDIAAWLKSIGLEQYAEAFSQHRITFKTLESLTNEDLKECGVVAVGDRKLILGAIQALSANAPHAAAASPTVVEMPKKLAHFELLQPIDPASKSMFTIPSVTTGAASAPVGLAASVGTVAGAGLPTIEPQKLSLWRRVATRRFLFISIAAHLLFGLIATVYVVQVITAKRKLTFTSSPPSPNKSQRALEHKVQMAKKQNTMSAPAQAKRIASTGFSKVSLPDMPVISTSTDFTPGKMAGMGGTGVGLAAAGGMGGGGGGGGPVPFFGLRDGAGLTGTFCDFKMDKNGKPTGISEKEYDERLRRWSRSGENPSAGRFYISPVKLSSKMFFFPAITDTGAGAAFQSPKSGPGRWMAVYEGSITTTESATYRFVGFGDNVLFVRAMGSLLLDASDKGFSGEQKRESGGEVFFPAKQQGTPIFFGKWFTFNRTDTKSIQIAVGDEGGIFCAGLFIQKRDMPYKQGEHGVPELPLFITSPLTTGDKEGLRKFLPDACLDGPVFSATASRGFGGAADIFQKQ